MSQVTCSSWYDLWQGSGNVMLGYTASNEAAADVAHTSVPNCDAMTHFNNQSFAQKKVQL